MRTIRAYIKNFPSVAGWFALQGAAKIAIPCLLSFSEKEEEGKKCIATFKSGDISRQRPSPAIGEIPGALEKQFQL